MPQCLTYGNRNVYDFMVISVRKTKENIFYQTQLLQDASTFTNGACQICKEKSLAAVHEQKLHLYDISK